MYTWQELQNKTVYEYLIALLNNELVLAYFSNDLIPDVRVVEPTPDLKWNASSMSTDTCTGCEEEKNGLLITDYHIRGPFKKPQRFDIIPWFRK